MHFYPGTDIIKLQVDHIAIHKTFEKALAAEQFCIGVQLEIQWGSEIRPFENWTFLISGF